ncbi:protein argonaute-2-like [Spodoptera frugiperda]|uniref:Protein argonaute-2-like n=1 Tax=Spodoptera frugiperda TaxID=7108 RepID=A0A9R0DG49_SPOFR|nr:protein argonaute-2-like [Spodoptera frugiperda]
MPLACRQPTRQAAQTSVSTTSRSSLQPEQPEQPEEPVPSEPFEQAEPLQEPEQPEQFEQPEEVEQPQDREPPPQRESRPPRPQRQQPQRQQPQRQQPQRQQPQRGHRFEQRKRYDSPQQKQAADWPRYREAKDGAPLNDELDARDYSPDRRGNPAYQNKRRDTMDGFVNQMQVAPVGQRFRTRQQQGGRDDMQGEGPTPPIDLDEIEPPGESPNNPEDADQAEQPEQQNEDEAQDAPDQQDDGEQREYSGQQDHQQDQNDQASDYSDGKHQDQAAYDEVPKRGSNQPQRGGRSTGPPPQNKRDHPISNKDLLYYMDDNQLRRNNIASDDQSFSDENESDEQKSSGNLTDNHSHGNASRATANRLTPGRPGSHRANSSSVYANGTKLNAERRDINGEVNATQRPRGDHTPRTFVVTVAGANVTYKLLTLKTRDRRRSGPRRFLEERAPHSVALISLDKAPLPAFRLPRMRRQYMHEPHDHRDPLDDVLPHHRRQNQ